MRFVRMIAGVLLLVIGIPAVFAGGTLWLVTRHADPGGAFAARFETVRTPGHAVVVGDLDRLLRQEAPFARTAQTGLRVDARTPDGPAFVGLAPTAEVRRWLEPVPHATVRRVALARGPLPVRLDPAGPAVAPAAGEPASPLGRPFWVREGIGSLEWSADDLAGEPMSLVMMRPDGGADLALDLRAELRATWTGPATWGLLALGVLLVVGAVLLLLRPQRPREVIFVVEPDQVPVLAGRLGVTSLSGLGVREPGAAPPVPTVRQLAPVGSGERARSAIGAEPAARPATLADLDEAAGQLRPPEVTLSLAWPPAAAEPTARPVVVEDETASGPPRCRHGGPLSPGDRCYPSDA